MSKLKPVLTLVLAGMLPIWPQVTHQNDTERSRNMIEGAIKEGQPLQTDLTVRGNVTAQAVLIPAVAARRVFGQEIANTYAVIAVTVSNKSPDAALIVQGAYIDYADWALSGFASRDGTRRTRADEAFDSFKARTYANQVASVESRLVRGQLLDAQQWTARNWTIRLLTLAGSIASGFSFSFKEPGIAKGIAAFNGQLVPGVSVAWPDGTIPQLNRISDFGYQTNKAIPKQGSDIIVCFFPVDRFLTPGFRKVFMKSPALFFAPFQMLVDETVKSDIQQLLGDTFSPEALKAMRKLLPCYMRRGEHQLRADNPLDSLCITELAAAPKTQMALDFLDHVSLNTIHIVIDGVMTVDTTRIAAKIDTVTFDQTDPALLWATAGEKKGTIKGSYLTGGQVKILQAAELGITDTAAITDGSSDQALRFSFKLTKPLPIGQKLTFVVSKKAKEGEKDLDSTYEYVVAYTLVAPGISKVEVKNGKATVTGDRFFDTVQNPLKVELQPMGGGKLVAVKLTSSTPTSVGFDLPADLAAGCWEVHVKVNEMPAPAGGDPFAVAPSPKIASAKKDGSVEGEGFVDTSKCGGPDLVFQAVEKKAGATPVKVTAKIVSATQVTLDLPAAAKTGTWEIVLLAGKEEKARVALQ